MKTVLTFLATLFLAGHWAGAAHQCHNSRNCSVRNVETQIRQTERDLRAANRSYECAERELRERRAALRAAEKCYNQALAEHQNIAAQVQRCEREIERLTCDQRELESRICQLRDRLAVALRQPPSRYNQGCRPSSDAPHIIRAKLQRAERSLVQVKQSLCRKQAELPALRRRCAEVQRRLAPLERKLQCAQKAEADAVCRLDRALREVNQLATQLARLEEQVRTAACGRRPQHWEHARDHHRHGDVHRHQEHRGHGDVHGGRDHGESHRPAQRHDQWKPASRCPAPGRSSEEQSVRAFFELFALLGSL